MENLDGTGLRPDGKPGVDSGLDWTGFFRGVIFFEARGGALFFSSP